MHGPLHTNCMFFSSGRRRKGTSNIMHCAQNVLQCCSLACRRGFTHATQATTAAGIKAGTAAGIKARMAAGMAAGIKAGGHGCGHQGWHGGGPKGKV